VASDGAVVVAGPDRAGLQLHRSVLEIADGQGAPDLGLITELLAADDLYRRGFRTAAGSGGSWQIGRSQSGPAHPGTIRNDRRLTYRMRIHSIRLNHESHMNDLAFNIAWRKMRPLNVDIVVPQVDPKRFSGGILCIFEHAQGLSDSGHHVRVVPISPSPYPEWFNDIRFDYYEHSRHAQEKDLDSAAKADPRSILSGVIGKADVTLATTCDTLLPVACNASGPKIYFMQHFAPYFMQHLAADFASADTDTDAAGRAGKHNALAFYQMGMKLVANSTWLKGMVEGLTGRADVEVCPNAIRLENFYVGEGHSSEPSASRGEHVTVISYGGRDAEWKGFREMAHVVAQVRRERPHVSLQWKVYGGALIPPKNDVADYEDLGYLDQRELGDAYRAADVLLSASWYESFPLFPLEAMACGLATITSAPGTEDYAFHGDTAHIVEPRSVDSIASGLRCLVDDVNYRRRLGLAGAAEARMFTWTRAVDRMDSLIRAAAKS
jgi:glycosyltransferase involved in cell wall biosynthesis